jgi:hypothetical protein
MDEPRNCGTTVLGGHAVKKPFKGFSKKKKRSSRWMSLHGFKATVTSHYKAAQDTNKYNKLRGRFTFRRLERKVI